MKALIRLEWIKVRHSRTFIAMFITYLVLFIGTVILVASLPQIIQGIISSDGGPDNAEGPGPGDMLQNMDFNTIPIMEFPDVWQNVFYLAGYFKLFLGIVVITLITNEIAYRTIRQNIIDGLSRVQFLTAKLLQAGIITVVVTVFVVLVILIMGFVKSKYYNGGDVLGGFEFALGFMLELYTYLMFAAMLSLLFRRAAITIILLLFYYLIESILAGVAAYLANKAGSTLDFFAIKEAMPFGAIGSIVPNGFSKYVGLDASTHVSMGAVGLSLCYLAFFTFVCYRLIAKKDL